MTYSINRTYKGRECSIFSGTKSDCIEELDRLEGNYESNGTPYVDRPSKTELWDGWAGMSYTIRKA